jgi:hypothetical protein
MLAWRGAVVVRKWARLAEILKVVEFAPEVPEVDKNALGKGIDGI